MSMYFEDNQDEAIKQYLNSESLPMNNYMFYRPDETGLMFTFYMDYGNYFTNVNFDYSEKVFIVVTP